MLSTKQLFHPDIGKAADELIANVELMIWCGYFQDAFEISQVLLRPGPWKCRPGGEAISVLSEVLPWLAWLLGQTCPAVDGNPPRGQPALAKFVHEREPYGHHFFFAGVQTRPNQTALTAEVLAHMPAVGTPGFAELYNAVSNELSIRIGQQYPNAQTQTLWAPAISGPPSAELSSQQLHEGVVKAVGKKRQDIPLIVETLLKFSLLELAQARTANAAAHLAPHLHMLGHELMALLSVPPFREFMKSGELAKQCGLSAEHIASYRTQLQQRSPATLTKPAPRLNWKALLKKWAQTHVDDIDFESMQWQAQHSLPPSVELTALAKRKKLLAKGAAEEELFALEQRIHLPLPPSYRDFLLTSNGLLRPDGIHLLPSGDVNWMHEIDPDTIEAWCSDELEASDEQYAIYGEDQDCIHMRPRHLRRALVISQSEDGDVWLLIPDVRFGAEWEAWFLGAKNPGAFRFRSFGDLFAAHAMPADD